MAGAVIMLVVGAIDDRRSLGPWTKLAWQIVAALAVLAGGIGITALTIPGGFISVEWLKTSIDLGIVQFNVAPVANLLSIIWIVGMINAVNFLDGVDGLADGVSAIASFCLFLLAVSVGQPVVALLALALTGAALGFLPYNFFPAKIFLGDSGAYFLGLVLATLAIYSGGKLATAVLVLGFTVIDGLLTVLRRLARHQSPFTADRRHLHHLLLDVGCSQRQTVLVYYLLAATLGLIALVSGTTVKLILFGLLIIGTAALAAILLKQVPKQP
jgi:UDP-GlcNAc:undecaprenyl-phosphate GlcNAc-1-phosphate transferase